MKKITDQQIKEIAEKNGYVYAALKAVILVEGSGKGFDDKTGKILIQFEPAWYKKIDAKDGFSGHGIWEQNKVENQAGEWKAFNDAFGKDPMAAMESTSIGMMQVMGFHWKLLGFSDVGAMWDYAKESEANQINLGVGYIKSIPQLDKALKERDWAAFAYRYNGAQYKKFNYDTRMATAYQTASKQVI